MSFATTPESAPITDLQTMLRSLQPELGLGRDGIYGEETELAVRSFQRAQGLPETGVTDESTWAAIVGAYQQKEVLRAPAEALLIVLQPGQEIRKEEENLHVYLLQGMLYALGQLYLDFPLPALTGVLDAPTQEGLRRLQESAGLEQTGALDKNTWRHLALQYRSAIGDGTGTYPLRRSQRPLPKAEFSEVGERK